MNTFLESVPLLYFLFFATLVHLGYFLLLRDTQSIFIFCLVSIFVYLVIPNMVVVLAITLLFVDMLYILKSSTSTSKEGFSGSVTFKDLSGVDISANEFIEQAINYSTNNPKATTSSPTSKKSKRTKSPKMTKSRPTKKQEMDIDSDSEDETDPSEGAELEEVEDDSKKMNNLIEKVKSASPEMVDSLKMLNSIDITELNKLINNMNKIATTMST